MNHTRFDDLTRAIAQGTSRRQALRLLGGSLLAMLVPGSVLAKGDRNNDAAKFCAQLFGRDTPAAGKCTSEAAKNRGLYATCGANPSSICCTRNTSGYCTSYDSATCCSSGQICQTGVCVSDPVLCNGTSPTSCTSNEDCSSSSSCYFDFDQTHRYCYSGIFGDDCLSDCECPQGYFCSTGGQSSDREATGYCVPAGG